MKQFAVSGKINDKKSSWYSFLIIDDRSDMNSFFNEKSLILISEHRKYSKFYLSNIWLKF